MTVKAVQVSIIGQVQGVGYRAWVEDEALRLGLAGWVRNRRDGSVEAVFSGEARAVDAMVVACDTGPRSAVVFNVAVAGYDGPALTRFRVMPTE